MKKQQDKQDLFVYRAFGACLIAAIIFGIVTLFVSCKTIKVDGDGSHKKDSTKIEYRIDTFYQVIKDSVTIQLPCSDSIEVAYVDRWHTDTKYVKKEIHDTISVCSIDSIPYPVPYEVEKVVKSKFDKFTNIWFYVTASLLIGAILAVVGVFAFKAYFHV